MSPIWRALAGLWWLVLAIDLFMPAPWFAARCAGALMLAGATVILWTHKSKPVQPPRVVCGSCRRDLADVQAAIECTDPLHHAQPKVSYK